MYEQSENSGTVLVLYTCRHNAMRLKRRGNEVPRPGEGKTLESRRGKDSVSDNWKEETVRGETLNTRGNQEFTATRRNRVLGAVSNPGWRRPQCTTQSRVWLDPICRNINRRHPSVSAGMRAQRK